MEINRNHCSPCGMPFKTNKCLRKHLKCKRHTDRMNKITNLPSFMCDVCGKKYSHRQSLHTHKMSCVTGVVTVPVVNNATPFQEILQLQIDEMKISFEKERQEIKLLFDKSLKEQIQKIAVVDKSNKSRNKRKKTTKEMRQHIADKQQKLCGECKLGLTLHFQIDHIIGLQFGGTDDESNLMALCCECHAVKSVAENRCRKRIQDAIKTILRETTLNN